MKRSLEARGGDAIPTPEQAEAPVVVVNGEPTIGGSETPVAALVHACHETGIDGALAALAIPGLDRETLEPVLTYCAERRCVADEATCPGCRRRTEAEGFVAFDDFVAAHREIATGEVRLTGPGDRTLTTPSLERLARTWAGEEYWFWARRVLRKLRHGLRRAHIHGAAPDGEETPTVILMEPQLADNIGMAARAMANFGLDALRLVNPRDGWPNEKARIAASGANHVIDDTQAFGDLSSSIADLHWCAATTARQRDLRKPVLTPEQAVQEMRTRMAAGQRCGVLFGRERNGLTTSEVASADALVMIPVNSAFASLNLGQAVLLVAYEWMRVSPMATLGRVTAYEKPVASGLNLGADRPAAKSDLLGLFEHLEGALDDAGFFNPPEKRAAFVQNLRTTLTRIGATEQEVRTLRGIVATLAGRRRQP